MHAVPVRSCAIDSMSPLRRLLETKTILSTFTCRGRVKYLLLSSAALLFSWLLASTFEGTFEGSLFQGPTARLPPDAVISKVLILYSYYEADPKTAVSDQSNTAGETARKNLEFFVRHGVEGPNAPAAEDATFVFIINGGYVSITIPVNLSNVNLLSRENQGLEFCGIAEALRLYNRGQFTHFIFLNSSIRGPFLPNYLSRVSWANLFLDMLTDKLKLVGISINCFCCEAGQLGCDRSCTDPEGLKYVHLQSFFLATDTVGLDLIYPSLKCFESKQAAIDHGELAISLRVREAGFNIASMDKFWFEHDFTDVQLTAELCTAVAHVTPTYNGDTQFPRAYFGMDHGPYESVFIKTNRGEAVAHQLYSRWSDRTEDRARCAGGVESDCSKGVGLQ